MKNVHWVLFILLFVFLSGCGKKSEVTPSKTEMISKNWKVQKMTGETGGANIVLYERGKTGNLENYDNFSLFFVNNGTFTGKDKDGNMMAGAWKLTENESKLSIILPDDSGEFAYFIQNLSSNNLDVFITEKDETSGKDIKITYFLIPM